MNYYALQVKTNNEEIYIKLASCGFPVGILDQIRLVFPRRKLSVRKAGIVHSEISPIFPGYIFLEAESLTGEIYWILRTTPGFFRFLPDSKGPKALEGTDLVLLKHFISLGEIANHSKVRFDENDRIQVLEGPLKGLEGKIIKVDKRKGRAKVKLDLYDESFLIDLAFELMDQHK